jgi:cytochrome c-type biogenesis protein
MTAQSAGHTTPFPPPQHSAWRVMVVLVVVSAALYAVATPALGGQGNAVFLINISLLAALLGGVLSILSPCSAAMLPIFFAYAFKERTQLVRMTFIFWLGLATIFIPLGFGAGLLSKVFVTHRTLLFQIAAVIFLLYGLWAIVPRTMKHRTLPGFVRSRPASMLSIYVMGILTAFASGTCTAPILGAILTLAATQSSPFLAFILLGTYSLGLVGPLFLLSYGFERWNWKHATWMKGKLWTIPMPGNRTYSLHSSNALTASLFLFLAWVFWFGNGTYRFLEPLAKSGIIDAVYTLNERILAWSTSASPIISIVLIAIFGLFVWRRLR